MAVILYSVISLVNPRGDICLIVFKCLRHVLYTLYASVGGVDSNIFHNCIYKCLFVPDYLLIIFNCLFQFSFVLFKRYNMFVHLLYMCVSV